MGKIRFGNGVTRVRGTPQIAAYWKSAFNPIRIASARLSARLSLRSAVDRSFSSNGSDVVHVYGCTTRCKDDGR
jgi:hypothetical protein